MDGANPLLSLLQTLEEKGEDLRRDGLLEDSEEGAGLAADGDGHGQMLHPCLDLTLRQQLLPKLHLLQEERLNGLLVPHVRHLDVAPAAATAIGLLLSPFGRQVLPEIGVRAALVIEVDAVPDEGCGRSSRTKADGGRSHHDHGLLRC